MIELDEIGLIPDQLGEWDASGNETTPTTYVTGWHVNALEAVPEFSAYLIDPQPTTPYRVFAGNSSLYAYKFPSQETFNALRDTLSD